MLLWLALNIGRQQLSGCSDACFAFVSVSWQPIHSTSMFAGGERSWEFKSSPLSKQKVFDTEHVWTFHIHQHIVDLSTFTLQVFKQFDITHYLDGQPLQSMIKDRYTTHEDMVCAWLTFRGHTDCAVCPFCASLSAECCNHLTIVSRSCLSLRFAPFHVTFHQVSILPLAVDF